MQRKLIVRKDMPVMAEGFPVAVCHHNGAADVVIGWFRTEADARLFAGVEGQIAQLRRDLERARSRTSSAYYRGMLACPPNRSSI